MIKVAGSRIDLKIGVNKRFLGYDKCWMNQRLAKLCLLLLMGGGGEMGFSNTCPSVCRFQIVLVPEKGKAG